MFTTNVDALHLHVCFDARPRWCGVRTTARKTPPSSVRRWPAFWTTWGSSTSPAMSWSRRYTHLVSITSYLRNIYVICIISTGVPAQDRATLHHDQGPGASGGPAIEPSRSLLKNPWEWLSVDNFQEQFFPQSQRIFSFELFRGWFWLLVQMI